MNKYEKEKMEIAKYVISKMWDCNESQQRLKQHDWASGPARCIFDSLQGTRFCWTEKGKDDEKVNPLGVCHGWDFRSSSRGTRAGQGYLCRRVLLVYRGALRQSRGRGLGYFRLYGRPARKSHLQRGEFGDDRAYRSSRDHF